MTRWDRVLRDSVWALCGFSLCALILTRELENFAAAAILTLTPLLYYFDRKERLPASTWAMNALILIDFAFAAGRFFYLKDSFLLIVADFLVFFMILKFAFKKDRNDFLQMIYLSFFILLSCSTLSLDFSFLASFILYILIVSWTLSVYQLSLSQASSDVLQPQENLPEIFQRLRHNAWMTLTLALVFAFIIFAFFPRMSVAVFQGAFLGPVHQTGFTEQVNLQQSGKIFRDPAVVMRVQVKSAQGQNGRGFLYLRGQALSNFDGKSWTAGERQAAQMVKENFKSKILQMGRSTSNRFQILSPDDRKAMKTFARMKLAESDFLKQTIFMESMDTSLLFSAPWAESVTAKIPRLAVYQDGTLSRPSEFKGRISYEVTSLIERPPTAVLQTGPAPKDLQLPYDSKSQDEEISKNLELPENSQKISDLALRIFSARDLPHAKAAKTEKYLRENYKYTLDLKAGDDPLNDFLFGSKEGHCEYFASAMVMILRSQGIPARMATGFLMDEKNSSGDYYTVRAQDAHAWVEALLGGFWVQFDPTPRASRFDLEKLSVWQKVRQKADYLNFLWISNVLGYDQELQEDAARKVIQKSSRLSIQVDHDLSDLRRKISVPWKKTLMYFFMVAAVGGLWAAKKILKSRTINLRGKGPEDKFYDEMLKLLERKGFPKEEGETPHEYRLRINGDLNEISSAVLALTELFCASRYGHVPLDSSQQNTIKTSLKNLRLYLK